MLSGGDGHDSKGRDVRDRQLNVKDEANAAARDHGRWISVLNTMGRSRDCLPIDRGLVMWPETGNRRNLLEAALSDACVVLGPGAGDGTLSELVSALCLGRPVLLLADPARAKSPWPAVHSWFADREVAGEAVEDVLRRTRSKLGGPEGVLGDLVRTSVTKDNLRVTKRCECHALDADAAVASWVASRLEEKALGRFPDVSPASAPQVAEFRRIKTTYEAWLQAG